MRAYERLLRYVKFDTASDASSQSCPSTKKQLALVKALAEELSGLGLADAHVDKFGYVYATLPANCEGQPTIGLIAHMDTVDVVPTTGVSPVLLPYEGGPVAPCPRPWSKTRPTWACSSTPTATAPPSF